MSKYRSYAFTSFDVDCPLNPLALGCKFLIYQLEKASTTDRLHYQGVIVFASPRSFNAVRKMLKNAHIEPTRNVNAAINYCRKNETRVKPPVIWGEPPKPRGRKKGQTLGRPTLKKFREISSIYDNVEVDDLDIHRLIVDNSMGVKDPVYDQLCSVTKFCGLCVQDYLSVEYMYRKSRGFVK